MRKKRHFVWNSKKILCISSLSLILYNQMKRIFYIYIFTASFISQHTACASRWSDIFLRHMQHTSHGHTTSHAHELRQEMMMMFFESSQQWKSYFRLLSIQSTHSLAPFLFNNLSSLHVMWKITLIRIFFSQSDAREEKYLRWKFLWSNYNFESENVHCTFTLTSSGFIFHIHFPARNCRHMFDNFFAQLNTISDFKYRIIMVSHLRTHALQYLQCWCVLKVLTNFSRAGFEGDQD